MAEHNFSHGHESKAPSDRLFASADNSSLPNGRAPRFRSIAYPSHHEKFLSRQGRSNDAVNTPENVAQKPPQIAEQGLPFSFLLSVDANVLPSPLRSKHIEVAAKIVLQLRCSQDR